MTVTKRKPAGLAVERGGKIDPLGNAGADPEPAVVNAPWAFVHHDEDVGRAHALKVDGLAEGGVRAVVLVSVLGAGEPGTRDRLVGRSAVAGMRRRKLGINRAHPAVHGIAARSGHRGAGKSGRGAINNISITNYFNKQ